MVLYEEHRQPLVAPTTGALGPGHNRAAEPDCPSTEIAIPEGPRLQGAAWQKTHWRLRPKANFGELGVTRTPKTGKSGISGTGKLRDRLEVGEADIWRKNVLHPPTATGIKILDLPPLAKNHCHH